MKYDPDVPMTKEQAAVWRREQRRKRNRESAAASRQRQRDRICELEEEVEDWKQQYDIIMSKIRLLETDTNTNHHEEDRHKQQTLTIDATTTRSRTPEILQGSVTPSSITAIVTPRPLLSNSYTTTTTIMSHFSSSSSFAGEVSEDETHVVSLNSGNTSEGEQDFHHHQNQELQHSSKMTSRPAVS